MFRQVLANRGHNPDLVQVIGGYANQMVWPCFHFNRYGDTGAALVKGKIDLAFFIGSPQTGKKVMAAAVDNLTPVVLELGGKVRRRGRSTVITDSYIGSIRYL